VKSAQLADRRIRLLLTVLLFAFAAALGRAVWLQAVQARPLARLATSQHRETIATPARRGTIFDRTGSLLAIGEQATTVYADPRHVRDPRAVAAAAARILHLDPGKLAVALANRKRHFVYVRRQADSRRAAQLQRLRIPGLGFYPEERRSYPQGSVGAHLLGFAGVENRGLAGLELKLDDVLAGQAGSRTIVKDPFGRVLDVVGERLARDGRDVQLTLDHNIQATTEAVLRQTVRRWHATAASAVVLDPRNGEVLALADAPGFDANRFGSTASTVTRNRAVTDTYEPGSTFKLITVAGVLSEGLVAPSTAFTLAPRTLVADRWIHDSHPRETETMTVSEILARSSNVGVVTLAQMLGAAGVADWVDRFGFGRPTGIEFPGETPGIVLPLENWSGSTIGNVPIGQGIAVTPVQMAAAYAAVANHGVWVRPHLVARVGRKRADRTDRRRVVSRPVARTLVEMLRGVVSEAGTGAEAAIPGYEVAGKTGTAQKPDGRGGYALDRYVASFVGFVPATAPRLVVLVSVDEPHGAIWGGVVAAPAFQEIAKFALRYLEVPPDAGGR
jgi:cell division protein FtsI (penicillin-binding protein 3)